MRTCFQATDTFEYEDRADGERYQLPHVIRVENRGGRWSYIIDCKRPPKAGEIYLSGNPVEGWLAPNDLTTPYIVVVPQHRYKAVQAWTPVGEGEI